MGRIAQRNPEFTARLLSQVDSSGLNSKRFAEAAGIKYSTLNTYLRGDKNGRVPEWDILVKISVFTKCSTDWLLTGKNPDPIYQEAHNLLTRQAMADTKAIIESGNPMFTSALMACLTAFKSGIKN